MRPAIRVAIGGMVERIMKVSNPVVGDDTSLPIDLDRIL